MGGSQTLAPATHTTRREKSERDAGQRRTVACEPHGLTPINRHKQKREGSGEFRPKRGELRSPAATVGRRRRGRAGKEDGGRPLVTGKEEGKRSSDTLKLRF